MATFITSLEPDIGTGARLAVKDLIDVVGVPTTAGSAAVAQIATPAGADAACLLGARQAGARIVGKANLHELAFGTSGVNPWSGTPRNPRDARRVPGGSSSGSAVAVGDGEADLAFGSDTGGSIRIPSAFCGTTGLKTTTGRVSLAGVFPLAPSFDTVGPMARDVSATAAAMALLEPGFAPASTPARIIGRLRPSSVEVDPVIDDAIDDALRCSEFEIIEVALEGWADAHRAGLDILLSEALATHQALLADPVRSALVSAATRERLESGRSITDARRAAARTFLPRWRQQIADLLGTVELLALPSVGFFAPLIEDAGAATYNGLTLPVNLAGVPALSLPVRTPGPFPASLQLIGPADSEELLLATGQVVEQAAGDIISL